MQIPGNYELGLGSIRQGYVIFDFPFRFLSPHENPEPAVRLRPSPGANFSAWAAPGTPRLHRLPVRAEGHPRASRHGGREQLRVRL